MIELSVVIPTYNRAERLRACLQALGRQTLPHSDFEVIVVVDGSTDGTHDMLHSLTVPFPLTVHRQENQGQNVARNRGAAVARGRYLLFLDDDIVAAPEFVGEHLRVQRSEERTVGIGQITLTLPPMADWFTRQFAEGWREHYEELNHRKKVPTWLDCYSGNVSMERSVFVAVDGFAEDVRRNDDIELGYRLMGNGASFVYVPGAVGCQGEHKTIRELASDFRSAGVGYVQLVQRHPRTLPDLLGGLADASLRERLLRQTLHLLRLSPRLLGWLGAALRDPGMSQKWFRFLYHYFYWSGVRQAIHDRMIWRQLMHGTPILMYHAFGGQKERGSRFVIPIHRFAQQMKWLHRMGYKVVGLEEFLRCRREYRLPPPGSVVLTIDDGYGDEAASAYEVLRRYGYPATVFVVTDRVGKTDTWSNGGEMRGRQLLSWNEIAQLAQDGIEFGAHTMTHPTLPELPAEQVRQEVVGSKQELESRLQVPVRSFAYPYGESDATSEQIVEDAGFWAACGIDPGLNTPGTPSYALRRVEIDGTLPLFRFLLALRTGNTHLRMR